MSWRVARSLDVLLEEINAAAPRRSKISDGSIGDAAHASRDSDHNPWRNVGGVGVVGARDFTHDPAGGLDCNDLARFLVSKMGTHPALTSGAYVIWQRRILSRDRQGEGWRAYTGSNPHDHHLHLSVATSASGFDSTQPWGILTPEPEEDPMTDYAAQLDRIEEKLDAQADATLRQTQRVMTTLRTLRNKAKITGADIDDVLDLMTDRKEK